MEFHLVIQRVFWSKDKKTPAHHHLVHSWQPKLRVTKNKFALKDAVFYPVRILKKRASEDRSQTSCLGAALEKCAQPQCLGWEFLNIASNCVDWVPQSDFVNVRCCCCWDQDEVRSKLQVLFLLCSDDVKPFPSGLLERLEWQWLRCIVLWVSGGMAGSSQQKNRRKNRWEIGKAQKDPSKSR